MEEWYGAKAIFLLEKDNADNETHLYEERVIVLKASSFEQAISGAEKEALEYADADSGIKYIGYVNVFKLFEDTIAEGTEVFSLIRKSNLNEKDYLNTFFDTGLEITKKV